MMSIPPILPPILSSQIPPIINSSFFPPLKQVVLPHPNPLPRLLGSQSMMIHLRHLNQFHYRNFLHSHRCSLFFPVHSIYDGDLCRQVDNSNRRHHHIHPEKDLDPSLLILSIESIIHRLHLHLDPSQGMIGSVVPILHLGFSLSALSIGRGVLYI